MQAVAATPRPERKRRPGRGATITPMTAMRNHYDTSLRLIAHRERGRLLGYVEDNDKRGLITSPHRLEIAASYGRILSVSDWGFGVIKSSRNPTVPLKTRSGQI